MMILKYFFLMLLCLIIIIWYCLVDNIHCIVTDSSSPPVNGYYVAKGGIYINIATKIESIPDIFQILSIHSTWSKDTTIIAQDKHEWGFFSLIHRQKLYYNLPLHPQEYLFHPPPDNWKLVTVNSQDQVSSLYVSQCIGSLADSDPLIPERSQTNLQIMLNRPVTTVLCLSILTIAYILWSQRIEVSTVSYSYDAIVNRDEYWRIFSASFSHFDLLHLAFNLMSLYQLGTLEPIYSSPLFLTLNFTLVIITMVIATGLYHYLIYKWNRHDLIYQQAVGYSCVLFAWMVASSVRMEQYCPLFFLPSLCFNTFFISLPFLPIRFNLPINIGPFILLIVTKFILPRSSLIGHLSGILIGFPLAWNWLNFLTPTLVVSLLAIFLLINNRLFVWKFPGYAVQHTFTELEEFVAKDSLNLFIKARYLFVLLTIVTITIFMTTMAISFTSFFSNIIPRGTLLLFTASSILAMRCVWLTDLQTVHIDCALLIVITCFLSFFQSIIDMLSCLGLIIAKELVISSLLLTYEDSSTLSMYWCGLVLSLILSMIEFLLFVILLQSLHKIKLLDSYLAYLQLDRQSFNHLMRSIGIFSTSQFGMSTTSEPSNEFSQPSHLPVHSTSNTSGNQIARAAIERQAALPTIFSGNRTRSAPKSTDKKKKNDTTSTSIRYHSLLPSSDDDTPSQQSNSMTL